MYIFIDDIRMPHDVTWAVLPSLPEGEKWTIVRSFDDFLHILSQDAVKISAISFDHDLADQHYGGNYSDEKTGYDCAKALAYWCVETGNSIPEFTVHSMNPVGKKNIEMFLNGARKFIKQQ